MNNDAAALAVASVEASSLAPAFMALAKGSDVAAVSCANAALLTAHSGARADPRRGVLLAAALLRLAGDPSVDASGAALRAVHYALGLVAAAAHGAPPGDAPGASLLVSLLPTGGRPRARLITEKLAATIAALALRAWPNGGWPGFANELAAAAASDAGAAEAAALALTVLAGEASADAGAVAPSRRADVLSALCASGLLITAVVTAAASSPSSGGARSALRLGAALAPFFPAAGLRAAALVPLAARGCAEGDATSRADAAALLEAIAARRAVPAESLQETLLAYDAMRAAVDALSRFASARVSRGVHWTNIVGAIADLVARTGAADQGSSGPGSCPGTAAVTVTAGVTVEQAALFVEAGAALVAATGAYRRAPAAAAAAAVALPVVVLTGKRETASAAAAAAAPALVGACAAAARHRLTARGASALAAAARASAGAADADANANANANADNINNNDMADERAGGNASLGCDADDDAASTGSGAVGDGDDELGAGAGDGDDGDESWSDEAERAYIWALLGARASLALGAAATANAGAALCAVSDAMTGALKRGSAAGVEGAAAAAEAALGGARAALVARDPAARGAARAAVGTLLQAAAAPPGTLPQRVVARIAPALARFASLFELEPDVCGPALNACLYLCSYASPGGGGRSDAATAALDAYVRGSAARGLAALARCAPRALLPVLVPLTDRVGALLGTAAPSSISCLCEALLAVGNALDSSPADAAAHARLVYAVGGAVAAPLAAGGPLAAAVKGVSELLAALAPAETSVAAARAATGALVTPFNALWCVARRCTVDEAAAARAGGAAGEALMLGKGPGAGGGDDTTEESAYPSKKGHKFAAMKKTAAPLFESLPDDGPRPPPHPFDALWPATLPAVLSLAETLLIYVWTAEADASFAAAQCAVRRGLRTLSDAEIRAILTAGAREDDTQLAAAAAATATAAPATTAKCSAVDAVAAWASRSLWTTLSLLAYASAAGSRTRRVASGLAAAQVDDSVIVASFAVTGAFADALWPTTRTFLGRVCDPSALSRLPARATRVLLTQALAPMLAHCPPAVSRAGPLGAAVAAALQAVTILVAAAQAAAGAGAPPDVQRLLGVLQAPDEPAAAALCDSTTRGALQAAYDVLLASVPPATAWWAAGSAGPAGSTAVGSAALPLVARAVFEAGGLDSPAAKLAGIALRWGDAGAARRAVSLWERLAASLVVVAPTSPSPSCIASAALVFLNDALAILVLSPPLVARDRALETDVIARATDLACVLSFGARATLAGSLGGGGVPRGAGVGAVVAALAALPGASPASAAKLLVALGTLGSERERRAALRAFCVAATATLPPRDTASASASASSTSVPALPSRLFIHGRGPTGGRGSSTFVESASLLDSVEGSALGALFG